MERDGMAGCACRAPRTAKDRGNEAAGERSIPMKKKGKKDEAKGPKKGK
jgi:hypothetical protein